MSTASPADTPEKAKAKSSKKTGGQIGPSNVEYVIALLEVVVPFIGVIAAIVLFWGNGVSALDLGLLAVMYTVTMIGVGMGFHRYFTHNSFETITPIHALLAISGCMAGQGGVKYWVGLHRIHHARSDKEGDPHSPHLHGDGWSGRIKGFLYAHVGWLFLHKADNKERIWCVMDLMRDPVVAFIDRLYLFWVALGLAIPAVIGGIVTGTWEGALTGFLWGGLVRMFLVNHSEFSINSICHLFGSRPYNVRDQSTNNPWVGLLAFGDGWHNNHHKFPTAAVHGFRWWQFDLSGILIRAMEAVGLAWKVRMPSKEALEKAKTTDTEVE